jgi:hypothetical protein
MARLGGCLACMLPKVMLKRPSFCKNSQLLELTARGAWLVVGDFNMILNNEDKNNSNLDRAMMGRFRRWKDDLALIEIPLVGRKYTWSNGQNNPTLVHLDRMFCSTDWEDLFPGCLLQSAASQDSDHCPLLLGLQDVNRAKGRFFFQAFWVKLEGFHDTVAQAWSSVAPGPCPFVTLSRKLQATARALQSWSVKTVGCLKLQLEMARELLHMFEMAQELRVLSPAEDWFRRALMKRILALSSWARSVARLRSRVTWLRDGDANTSPFHAQARFRKKNFIASLTSTEGEILTSHDDKATALFDFYDGLLGTAIQRDASINLDELGLQSFDLGRLNVPFSNDEVWDTIKSITSDKAPGPNGFTGRFYKSCWSIIKLDVMAAVSRVWDCNFRNFGLLNSALITLLPKIEGAALVKDFRPISLIHSFAKLVTKMVANRLAGHLNAMVPPNQTAFIKKRFILDNFILVQRTARYLHQQRQARILFKLDISKAFDSVSWSFLIEVLRKMGFGQIWCDVVSGLLATSSTRILLNGVPGEIISHQRGLRQGDPLSPMLFILVMDVLNLLIQKASDEGLLQQLSSGTLHHRLSLYADDAVVFLRSVASDINLVLEILRFFGEASGSRPMSRKVVCSPSVVPKMI